MPVGELSCFVLVPTTKDMEKTRDSDIMHTYTGTSRATRADGLSSLHSLSNQVYGSRCLRCLFPSFVSLVYYVKVLLACLEALPFLLLDVSLHSASYVFALPQQMARL